MIATCLFTGCASVENLDTEQAGNFEDMQEYEIYTVQAELYSYDSNNHCGDLLDTNGEIWHFDNMYLYDTEYIITYGTDFELLSLQYGDMIVYFVN
jgi:hypothetical protein